MPESGGNGGRSTSAPVNTPSTPGMSAASLVSISVILAWAIGLRTKVTCSAPVSSGSRRSST